MVTAYLINPYGEKTALPFPTSLVINREIGAADDLTIKFPALGFNEYSSSKIELDIDNRIEFSGIIDEIKLTENEYGTETMIYARSKAALLLDNEAKPTDYKNADSALIAYNHILPFDIDYTCDDNGEYTDLSIYKGISHWQVIKNFCSACYSNEPFVNEEGKVVLYENENEKETLFFCNSGGIMYTSAYVNNKYYKLISSVFTKAAFRDDYDIENTNPIAESLGICRIRYVDGAHSGNNYGEKLIEQGASESLEVKVNIPDYLHCPLNSKGKIKLNNGDIYDNLRCYRIKQSLTENGFETVVTMSGKIERRG